MKSRRLQRVVLFLFIIFALSVTIFASSEFSIMTWNVRGYPEATLERQMWFSDVLSEHQPGILCVQEIANNDRVSTFLSVETLYITAAFLDSSDGQDNAIFFGDSFEVIDVPDPTGFSHPIQLAHFYFGEFSAYIMTVHLAWTDVSQRAAERVRLAVLAKALMALDPDLIVAGDFNTTGTPNDTIEGLAQDMGLTVLEPVNSAGTTCAGSNYDYILVSPSIMQEWNPRAEVITFDNNTLACEVSDHRPVLARFGRPVADVQIECIVYDGRVFRSESDEYVQITNFGTSSQNLQGWTLADLNDRDSGQEFSFKASFVLEPGQSIRVYTNEIHDEWGEFSFRRGSAVWNNTTPDTAVLLDGAYGVGQEIDRCTYSKCGEGCCSTCAEHQD